MAAAELVGALPEDLPQLRGILHPATFQQVEGRQRSRAGDKVSLERAPVRAKRPAHEASSRDERAERQAGGDALGDWDSRWIRLTSCGARRAGCASKAPTSSRSAPLA